MSVLRKIEQSIESVVERGFRRAFRSQLQPVELARKLAREMDDHKTVSVAKVYVPNEYTVYLASADREAFSSYEATLVAELAAYLEAHARGNGFSLVAPPTVLLETDGDLRPGEFGIACRMVDSPAPAAPPVPNPLAAPEPAAPRPAPPPAPANAALAGVSGTQVMSAEDARAAGLHAEAMSLVVNGTRYRLTKRITGIGRSRDRDVVIPDPNASRAHCEIRHVGYDYFLIDLDSTNGVEVNGKLVKRHALAHGDVITIGTTEIRVEVS
ncbi:MAG: FHA domain-containing protein [Thermoleophilia bacterium]|nr:FHA domain-containing protein [Thermoleophilia bacterium]